MLGIFRCKACDEGILLQEVPRGTTGVFCVFLYLVSIVPVVTPRVGAYAALVLAAKRCKFLWLAVMSVPSRHLYRHDFRLGRLLADAKRVRDTAQHNGPRGFGLKSHAS